MKRYAILFTLVVIALSMGACTAGTKKAKISNAPGNDGSFSPGKGEDSAVGDSIDAQENPADEAENIPEIISANDEQELAALAKELEEEGEEIGIDGIEELIDIEV